MELRDELRAYRWHLKNAKKIVIDEIRVLVGPHLSPHAGYCGLVCEFFSEHPKCDGSHPRERKVRGGQVVTGVMGFTDTGVIDDVWVALSTMEYDDIPVEDLMRLRSVARKFDAERRKVSRRE